MKKLKGNPALLQLTTKDFLETMTDDKDWMGFWKILQTRRKQVGLSQKELAEITGLEQCYISRLEGGHMNPTIRTVFRILNVLDSQLCIKEK